MKIRNIVLNNLVKSGYNTIHMGKPIEVVATQFITKKQVERLIQELEAFFNKKEIECIRCGFISLVEKSTPLKDSWCPQCRSAKIRLYKQQISGKSNES